MTTDILVIGAGQAALALAFHLRDLPYRYLLVDGNARIGDSWRKRYDSLTLFTPRAYSALPGRVLPGDPAGFPSKDEIADYLESYARHYDVPVVPNCRIASLRRDRGGFRATTEDGRIIESRAVVLANGAFQVPKIPALAQRLSRDVYQCSTGNYRRPGEIPGGNVLVVGDGASGRQIARELAATHRTYLCSGRPRRVIPHRVLGRSIFWWMERARVLTADTDSRIARYFRRVDPIPGPELKRESLERAGVDIVPRLRDACGSVVTFEDGRRMHVQAVVWATGYREDSSWLEIPEALDDQRQLIHRRGITPVPGLCVLGRAWQNTRGSALLLGVAADARSITENLKASLRSNAGAHSQWQLSSV